MNNMFIIFVLLMNGFVSSNENIIITPESCGTSLNGAVHKHTAVGGMLFIKMENIIGIYIITNTTNLKYYIGQSLNINDRIRRHKYQLNNGTHYNYKLLNDFNKIGIHNFKFEIIYIIEENSSKEQIVKILNEKEKEFIVKYDSFNNGYNLTSGGECFVVSEETKIKLSNSHKGIMPSELCRRKTRERFKGVPKSEKTKLKMSLSKKGKKKTYPSWNKGLKGYKIKPASEERKRKIGEAQMKEKNHNYGKTTPESVKQKCRESYHGEQCHLAKLNDDKVIEIKKELCNLVKGSVLAKRYNVSVSVISRIKLGKIWKHIIINKK